MRARNAFTVAVLSALVALAASATALAGEPPNQNDPCAAGGRNTCGTAGVGTYQRYRYGMRWFGDFRGAVDQVGRAATFCIDLRYWYPGTQYRYRELESLDGFRNREGEPVSADRLARMSYAIWNYGRSDSPNQQAATMLYVHGLMGDAAPGEVARDAIGPAVAGVYGRIERDAARLRGPYRLAVEMPARLTAATPAAGTVSVRSATGAPVPGVTLRVVGRGAAELDRTVTTGRSGVAALSVAPDTAGTLTLTVTSEPLAAPAPRVFVPSTPAAARNGQRLATARSATVQAAVTRPVAKAQPTITTRATPATLLVGTASRDRVTLGGVPASYRGTVTVRLFGPFRSTKDVSCTGTPAAESTFATTGRTTYTTAPAAPGKPGYYTYQLSLPESGAFAAVTTPCGVPAETIKVEAQPVLKSQVSADRVRPGQPLNTRVTVTGLSGETVPVTVELFGPFPTREAVSCAGPPSGTQTVTAAGDGDVRTPDVTPTVPGFYVYRERIAATEFVRAAEIACPDPLETAIVVASPQVTTKVSAQQAAPGATITDSVLVTGLGALAATVNVELWGPYPTADAMTCSGTPYWTGTVAAKGDGTYTTAPVTLDRAGYYTYRETVAEAPQNDAVATACGEASETTLVRATPTVVTQVQSEVVRPGSAMSDRVRVKGLGRTPATVKLQLFGPFATRAAIRCSGDPLWEGTVQAANGDGEYRSAPTRLPSAGFYVYRERLVGTPVVDAFDGECGVLTETSLGAPAILTGRGDPVGGAPVRAAQADRPTPTRVRIAAQNIDAPVTPVGIDVKAGILDVPINIQKAGWWRDGAAPGDPTGTAIIAGHVDSARAGTGAFFRLKNVTGGSRIQVTLDNGRTRTYRVTSVRTYLKADLPTSLFTVRGSPRLALVTCGGPFDARLGHYRDNIVVLAVPV